MSASSPTSLPAELSYPEDSDHFRCWIFSQPDIEALQSKVHSETVDRLSVTLYERGEGTPEFPSFEQTRDYLLLQCREFAKCVVWLAVQCKKAPHQRDPALVVDWYITPAAGCTALLFFQRFFLKRSVLEFPVEHIQAACLLLGVKMHAQCYHHRIETALKKHLGSSPKAAAMYELEVLKALDFQIFVVLPLSSVTLLGDEMLEEPDLSKEERETIRRVVDRVQSSFWYYTGMGNIGLKFLPAELAVALLKMSLEREDPVAVERIKSVLDRAVQNTVLAGAGEEEERALGETVNSIRATVQRERGYGISLGNGKWKDEVEERLKAQHVPDKIKASAKRAEKVRAETAAAIAAFGSGGGVGSMLKLEGGEGDTTGDASKKRTGEDAGLTEPLTKLFVKTKEEPGQGGAANGSSSSSSSSSSAGGGAPAILPSVAGPGIKKE
uniref:Uncharacterized protein n=1 Tax=Chromera velia CCMP2878 TaxID=1169474 RepID=A0A0G4GL04_9ALVE|eukprot:Cvel_22378.t1-p1 / transcript=Cvel_22378.t1 / gene=Cvel_22378 / organism=Chromera_velia_CCMP2878 / gene_product=hypothetical protein / transcript_product=hypothetical protein / location=Cvel_scaffold2193:20091-25432(-) / protein_length=439 / sequence_SO=supercontig / SO=protein_coding / is_pseudo=false